MPEIMTTKGVAKYLRLHEITIQRYASEGVIPSFRIGRSWRFSKEKIDEWLAGNFKDEADAISEDTWDKLGKKDEEE